LLSGRFEMHLYTPFFPGCFRIVKFAVATAVFIFGEERDGCPSRQEAVFKVEQYAEAVSTIGGFGNAVSSADGARWVVFSAAALPPSP